MMELRFIIATIVALPLLVAGCFMLVAGCSVIACLIIGDPK